MTPTQEKGPGLSDLTYCLLGLIVLEHLFQSGYPLLMSSFLRTGRVSLVDMLHSHFGVLWTVFLLLQLLLVLLFLRLRYPTASLFPFSLHSFDWKVVLAACGSALGVFLVSSLLYYPFDGVGLFLRTILREPYSPVSLLAAALLFLILPIILELVFRGVFFDLLSKHTSLTAAVVASSFAFAFWWPVLDFPVGFALATCSALFYYRTKSLWASVTLNITVTLLVGVAFVRHELVSR